MFGLQLWLQLFRNSKIWTHAIEAIRQKHDLPALAVVVVKDGQICDRVAVGVRKWGDPTPVTTNDVFHIGSCTKSMTATLTAMLIEEGKLTLGHHDCRRVSRVEGQDGQAI